MNDPIADLLTRVRNATRAGHTRVDTPHSGIRFAIAGILQKEAYISKVAIVDKGKFKYMRNYQPFNSDGLQNNYRYKMAAYTEWRDLFHAGKLNSAQSQFFRTREPEALYNVEVDPYETARALPYYYS